MQYDAIPEPPALVNLVLTKCHPAPAAYEATILDLAAQGLLVMRAGPGGPQVTLTGLAAASAVAFEQCVLDDVRRRLADVADAPVEALAQACHADVHGTWEPFENALRLEARARGICRARLTGTDRLTDLGRHRAEFWSGERRLAVATGRVRPEPAQLDQPALDQPALRQAGLAVAMGLPATLPGYPPPSGRGRVSRVPYGSPQAKRRPHRAWSSLTGNWRLVTIGSNSGTGLGIAAGVAMVVGSVWLGFIGWALSGPAGLGPVPLIIALLLAAWLCAYGGWQIVTLAAMPGRMIFHGQVIARWLEPSDSETGSGDVSFIAVDDGHQAWVFTGSKPHGMVALADLVQVTVNPRSRHLIELVVTGSARAGAKR